MWGNEIRPSRPFLLPPRPASDCTTNMKTRNLTIAVAMFLTTAIMTSTAQASLWDWFTSNKATADQASSGSFDQLYATVMGTDAGVNDDQAFSQDTALIAATTPAGNAIRPLRTTYTVQLSGYNSEVAQTDANPYITASGTHVRDGVVASNMFPFGTAIKIPALYGDKIFVVEDRMNSRYQHNVDIWFTSHSDALALGRRTVQVQVLH